MKIEHKCSNKYYQKVKDLIKSTPLDKAYLSDDHKDTDENEFKVDAVRLFELYDKLEISVKSPIGQTTAYPYW